MSQRIGYLITSHVAYQHVCLPLLLDSMFDNGISGENIVVVVNGAGVARKLKTKGVLYLFERSESAYHMIPFVRENIGSMLGINYWFMLSCTAECGPKFKHLVETGYDPAADATLAGTLLPLGKRGTVGRAINDLCMFRWQFLISPQIQATIYEGGKDIMTMESVFEFEGVLYALAPKKAVYPGDLHSPWAHGPRDVYESGMMRITEYFPAVDLYRYKHNWGTMMPGHYEIGP